jgi:predicted acyltransferase
MENTKRLVALDVFRGLTVALMIVVNNPGNGDFVYPLLEHSKWNGCTPTDLVFPFFMFIVGAAMWYSYKKFSYILTGNLVWKILRRTLLIYLIGLLLTAYSQFSIDLNNIRIMGVLPRIALGYGFASFIVLGMRLNWVKILTVLILLGYWAVLVIFGGDSPFSLEGNFVRTFDIAILGLNHIPQFHGVKFDQTGLLSTLPSIANLLLGYLAGRLIDLSEIKLNAVKKLILYGIAGIIVAKGWDLIFPINKPLWTSSFVLYTCSFASVLLGVLLWITDIKGFTKWTKPFLIFGMNPIFIYVLSEFLAISSSIKVAQSPAGESVYIANWIYDTYFLPLAGTYNGSLLYAIAFTLICWLAGWLLFYKKIIIKL